VPLSDAVELVELAANVELLAEAAGAGAGVGAACAGAEFEVEVFATSSPLPPRVAEYA